ncbi:MAG: NAD(P)H-hydrate dehydratase [Pseudomonadales bacterium]
MARITFPQWLFPSRLYSAAQVREFDRIAIEECGIPGIVLMKRAGKACFEVLRQRWPEAQSVTVFCGAGNNAGDGFIIAALAQQAGLPVQIELVGTLDKLRGDARRAYEFADQNKVPMQQFAAQRLIEPGVIVDALLGTGLDNEVREPYAAAIAQINASGEPVLAVDVPSGLSADSGAVLGSAVRADCTVTFIAMKQGLLTGRAPALIGALHFADLQVPDEVLQKLPPSARCLNLNQSLAKLPVRAADDHKGHFGHVLVVGGDHGMAGAALMAGSAAQRCGAGLVSVATQPQHVPAFVSRCPELMVHGVKSGHDLQALLQSASVVAIGPGLGHGPWSEQLLQRVLQTELPLVVDADALNMLSELAAKQPIRRKNWVLTPHPGEAGRLQGQSTVEIQSDRYRSVRDLQHRYGGTALLKGAGTLICDNEAATSVCAYGNPGMASGGMGDVLTGVIAALLAQHLCPGDAARLGACLHAYSADLAAADEGQVGLAATDLLPHLRLCLNNQ